MKLEDLKQVKLNQPLYIVRCNEPGEERVDSMAYAGHGGGIIKVSTVLGQLTTDIANVSLLYSSEADAYRSIIEQHQQKARELMGQADGYFSAARVLEDFVFGGD